MFGRDKNKKTEKQDDVVSKPADSWDDKVADALPQKASYFTAMRTSPFVNHNIVENYVEFWMAMQVNADEDKWRVMHYMIFDLDKEDGKFVSEAATKTDVSFPEAVFQLARFEYTSSKMMTHADFDMAGKYPAEKFPEMKAYFHDIEHYKVAANIEGMAFDEHNQPYRRVEGKVFADATFKRSEVVKSLLAVEQARDNAHVRNRIEGGILSDIFATASDSASSLDRLLKVGEVMAETDRFVSHIGAFYLGVQDVLGNGDGFDKIGGLNPVEKKALFEKAASLKPARDDFDAQALELLAQASTRLDSVKAKGVHVEPFQKFVAECELYAHLLNASRNRSRLEQAFTSPGNSNTDLIVAIRESVDKAQKKLVELGGTQEQMDKIKGWVNRNKESIPGWLPGFLTRYYETRAKIMQTVQDRKVALQDVRTMSATVKPPVTDEFNAVTPPSSGEAPAQEKPTAAKPQMPPAL